MYSPNDPIGRRIHFCNKMSQALPTAELIIGGNFNMVEWDGDRIIEKLVLPGVEGAGFPLLNNRIKPKDDAQLDFSLFGVE
jgi:hypothetical protein